MPKALHLRHSIEDQITKKLVTMHKALNTKHHIDKLYVFRKDREGRIAIIADDYEDWF